MYYYFQECIMQMQIFIYLYSGALSKETVLLLFPEQWNLSFLNT